VGTVAVRDLVIGMLLGDEDGEGRDDLFHYVLDNTEVQLDMPIDNKFKFSANLLVMKRMDVRDNSYGDWINGVDSDDNSVYDFLDYDTVVWCPCLIAWENNVPLFMTGYQSSSSNYVYVQHSYYTWENKRWYYRSTRYEYIPGSLRFENNEYEYVFNEKNIFQHRVSLPTVYYQTHDYGAYVRNTPGERPKVIGGLNPHTSNRSVSSSPFYWLWPGASGRMYDVHSDLSYQEVVSKYREMVEALYRARGINLRNCYVEPDEWE
jgi:hypothetical protein